MDAPTSHAIEFRIWDAFSTLLQWAKSGLLVSLEQRAVIVTLKKMLTSITSC